MHTRRDVLKSIACAAPAWSFFPGFHATAQQFMPPGNRFLFGGDVYPDIEDTALNKSLLDQLQRAQMNIVRVAEANWGNLELAPGHFNFGWLRDFLDELVRRKMWAIVGTSTFTPPQWLAAEHPEILVVLAPGAGPSDPMSRKSPCLNHPLYREACRRFIKALAAEFHDHPAIVGWQLDNEIEFVDEIICYNEACEHAWRRWLEQTYHTPEEFNERLQLVDWGMRIRSFDEVPQPRPGVERSPGTDLHTEFPALSLAELHFRGSTILEFLAEQASILRQAGAKQWVLTDWNPVWAALADEPKAQSFMSIAGLNYYQSSADRRETWEDSPWHLDMHRSAYSQNSFLVTETRFGVIGDTQMWDPAPTRDQFLMWGMQLAAFGASGMLYWSANRWRGGHWPHWGGLMDWSGHPEPDFDWACDLGRFFATWGTTLLAHPVESRAVVLTDFDNRAALEIYPHIHNSRSVLPQTFSALHRLGIGTDTINTYRARQAENLAKYDLLVLPATTALDDSQTVEAIHKYASGGGTVIVAPFTAYMDRDGVFRGDGFAANLADLTGNLVRTVRWTGSPANGEKHQLAVSWNDFLSGHLPVGLDGYMEYLEVQHPDTKVLATFESEQEIVAGRPAATLRRIGRGQVIKLAFWPADSSFLALIRKTVPSLQNFLLDPLPEGVMAVPRADRSLFVINTTSGRRPLVLRKSAIDRISKRNIAARSDVEPYQVLWLET